MGLCFVLSVCGYSLDVSGRESPAPADGRVVVPERAGMEHASARGSSIPGVWAWGGGMASGASWGTFPHGEAVGMGGSARVTAAGFLGRPVFEKAGPLGWSAYLFLWKPDSPEVGHLLEEFQGESPGPGVPQPEGVSLRAMITMGAAGVRSISGARSSPWYRSFMNRNFSSRSCLNRRSSRMNSWASLGFHRLDHAGQGLPGEFVLEFLLLLSSQLPDDFPGQGHGFPQFGGVLDIAVGSPVSRPG